MRSFVAFALLSMASSAAAAQSTASVSIAPLGPGSALLVRGLTRVHLTFDPVESTR